MSMGSPDTSADQATAAALDLPKHQFAADGGFCWNSSLLSLSFSLLSALFSPLFFSFHLSSSLSICVSLSLKQ
jgi:hypothetical protein